MRGTASTRRLLSAAGIAVALVGLTLGIAACGGSSSSNAGAAASPDTMIGAGSSFIAPILTKWGEQYAATGGTKLNYQSIGSGGGISAIEAKTVDFGASDAPLEQSDLETQGLVQFPMVVGGVVVVVHIDGVGDGQLRLTPDVLAKIYMGQITEWNDPAVAAINPGLKLPAQKINVVHRSDGSGTTWIFTHYLDAAAGKIWTAGADKEVPWPVGVGGKGNEGVAASVQQLPGSIGYVEYAYAKQTGMPTTQLQNAAGAWVKPSLDTFTAAAKNADWKGSLPSMAMVLVDQPGKTTWPITGATFILVQKNQADASRAEHMLDYFNWCWENGASAAASLDYVALPKSTSDLIEKEVWPGITVSGTRVWQ
jgi:phosphate transport system substrate-binding protein